MAHPQFARDANGRFAAKNTIVKVPAPALGSPARRFGRLHSAIKARNAAEDAYMGKFAGQCVPAYDDMYDLYSHYDS